MARAFMHLAALLLHLAAARDKIPPPKLWRVSRPSLSLSATTIPTVDHLKPQSSTGVQIVSSSSTIQTTSVPPSKPPNMKLPARSLIKKLVRAHLPPNTRLSKSADLYVMLAFIIHLQRLANESRVAHQIDLSNGLKGSRAITRRHINGARKRVRG